MTLTNDANRGGVTLRMQFTVKKIHMLDEINEHETYISSACQFVFFHTSKHVYNQLSFVFGDSFAQLINLP